jgi:hypothetical protein
MDICSSVCSAVREVWAGVLEEMEKTPMDYLLGIDICSSFCSAVREDWAGVLEEIPDTPVESWIEDELRPDPVPQITSYSDDADEEEVPRQKGHKTGKVAHTKVSR